jgi:hypothetical protein
LRLYWFNGATWEEISPGGVNIDENYVWGTTNHFSYYSLGGSAAESPSGGSSTRKVTFDPDAEAEEFAPEDTTGDATQPSQDQSSESVDTSAEGTPVNTTVIAAVIMVAFLASALYFIRAPKKGKKK